MQIKCFIHAPFEKPGLIIAWAEQNKHQLTEIHHYAGDKLPSLSDTDFLIIMGGPQSCCTINEHPDLVNEVRFTQECIAQNKPVLGICLGAQIIIEALGARTEKSPQREIGIFPIQLTPAASQDPVFKQFPSQFPVVHWHSDMPGQAQGMTLLAASAGCPRQAFRYGDHVYGLQYHMEMTPAMLKEMIQHCSEDLVPGTYIQTAEQMLAHDVNINQQRLFQLLDYLATVGQ